MTRGKDMGQRKSVPAKTAQTQVSAHFVHVLKAYIDKIPTISSNERFHTFAHSVVGPKKLIDHRNFEKKMANELTHSFITTEEDIPAESRNADEHFTDVETREDDPMEKDGMHSSSHHVFSFQNRESLQESPVLLCPRPEPSYDDLDASSCLANLLICRSPEEEQTISPTSTAFCRSALPSVSMPPFLSDIRDKPSLLRCFAWSQDSQEERRMTKRRKENPAERTTDSSRPTLLRRDSSPTMVHWEEKIDTMELSDALRHSGNSAPLVFSHSSQSIGCSTTQGH
jgi:hypothetical protein